MRNHSGVSNYTTVGGGPPIVAELEAIFRQLPDDDLIAKLRGKTRRGPKGHDPEVLWRCYITYYYLGLDSVSTLIRLLHDNPYVAQACGMATPNDIPSQPTFSRFGTKLAKHTGEFILAVKNVHRDLTRKLSDSPYVGTPKVRYPATDRQTMKTALYIPLIALYMV